MSQTPEAQAFLARIAALPPGPGISDVLSQALQPSLDDEAVLRTLWATDKSNSRLNDPHVGLVDVFDAPDDIRKTRARIVTDDVDLYSHYILPLSAERRRKEGDPAMVASLEEFKKNWALFTEGSLSQLIDWSNVVAAGGSVQACLAPVPDSAKTSKRAMRKYYHNNAFPTSDIDLFLYGLTPEQAEKKMQTIYEAVRDSVPWDVTCVRTKHTISIHSQYPYRSVQIVLRLYSSPAEILAGFDVDAPCCAFDGERVWANPRAIVAMMRQSNTVDMTRRSPSYEVRLTKYSMRDFEVYVPSLRREDIDPTIFERSIQRVLGLARLLVLERLVDTDSRERYLSDRRKLRSRPEPTVDYARRKKKLKGDLKANLDIGGVEMNDYDVQSLHIPYGSGWDSRRIDKLVYQTDLGMNSPYNPKNKDRRLHRHPAFFGTMEECLEDCCEFCPEPKDEEEKALQDEEDGSYVRGRIQFIEEDPGRQSMSGSFHPIDEGEWAEQAYVGPTEKLFNAIVAHDRATVANIISAEGFDVDRRDYVGRTPLQVAILSKAVDIACDLIDAGARMTSRLVDGRTALHVAAQLDLPVVVKKLLERSAVNDEKAKAEEAAKKEEKEAKDSDTMDVDDEDKKSSGSDDDEERDSSEDDWSSDGEDKPAKDAKKTDDGQIPEDEKDEPDVFDVNVADWDLKFTPLHYAAIFGSLGAIDQLLAAGADPNLATKAEGYWAKPFHPLTLTALTRDVHAAGEVVKRLVAGGAKSSQADDDLFTIFHRVVCAGRVEVIEALLSHDPNAKAVINSPYVTRHLSLTHPIVSAIYKGNYATIAVLLANGARFSFTEEDVTNARSMRSDSYMSSVDLWPSFIYWPIETAMVQMDDAAEFLLDIGADFNKGIRRAYGCYNNNNRKKTLLDAAREMCTTVEQSITDCEAQEKKKSGNEKLKELAAMPGWKGELGKHLLKVADDETKNPTIFDSKMRRQQMKENSEDTRMVRMRRALEYYTNLVKFFEENRARTWKDLYPDDPTSDPERDPFFRALNHGTYWVREPLLSFYTLGNSWNSSMPVPGHLLPAYEELFEACRTGDNAKIEELCLPKDGKAEKPLIQVTAQYGENVNGCTTLSLALENRHWSTARLVLAIAVAQYKPKDEKTPKFKVSKITLDDDESGDDSDEDSDMDDEEEPQEVNFVDIAQRRSEVQVEVRPERPLQILHTYQNPKTKQKIDCSVLYGAIMNNDFEAFVQIADLYKSLPKPLDLPGDALSWVLSYDRPNMLDELIRRTGSGIELPEDCAEDEDDGKATDGEKKKAPSKTYLGLNVHGKKRKDLAQKGDPNAPTVYKTHQVPILWTAAHSGAAGCVSYLTSGRVLGAYQYYASTHSDERARYLSRVADQLPQKLGIGMNELNESAVTAAVVGDKLDVLKSIIDLRPAQMQPALMARIHYAGFNHILVGANWACSPYMFDYLLSKGVSPTDTDCRGWNIYHILAANSSDKHLKLLKHVLEKLPEDVTQNLLIQQSKKAWNTPLQIAIKRQQPAAVRLLLCIKAPVFLLRDLSGQTPLHLAVHSYAHEIVKLVGEAGPDEAFTLEDSVGNTPLEIAIAGWLQYVTRDGCPTVIATPKELDGNMWHIQQRRRGSSREEAKALSVTVARLLAQGRLRAGTKLANALVAFAEHVQAAVDNPKKDPADEDIEGEEDECEATTALKDQQKTLDYVASAVEAKPELRRQLVHLLDVHRSVQGSLEKSQMNAQQVASYRARRDDNEGGLDPEEAEDNEKKAKDSSAITKWSSGIDVFGDDPY